MGDLDILLRPISGGADVPPPPPEDPPPPPPPPTVAEPHLVGTPAGPANAAWWIAGSEFRYRAPDATVWACTGTAESTPAGAVAGSFLGLEGEDMKYIDALGVKRRFPKTSLGPKHPDALPGSQWHEDAAYPAGKDFHWIGTTTRWHFWNGIA